MLNFFKEFHCKEERDGEERKIKRGFAYLFMFKMKKWQHVCRLMEMI